jgi:hypothetical protein
MRLLRSHLAISQDVLQKYFHSLYFYPGVLGVLETNCAAITEH